MTNYCVDCKHFRAVIIHDLLNQSKTRCVRKVPNVIKRDDVTGKRIKTRPVMPSAYEERARFGDCGPDAKFFEPRVGLWEAIWKKLCRK